MAETFFIRCRCKASDLVGEKTVVTTASPEPGNNPLMNEVLASVAESCARDHATKSASLMRYARSVERDLYETRSYQRKLQRKLSFWKKTAKAFIIGNFLLGFGLGAALGVSDMLRYHGPTVTLIGTLGACVLYLLSGLFFGGAFMFVCRLGVIDNMKHYKRTLVENEDIIEDLKAKRNDALAEARKFEKLSEDERRKSAHYRGSN